MNTNEFKALIASDAISKVTFVGSFEAVDSKIQWSVWAESREEVETKIGSIPRFSDYWKNSSRDKGQKVFTSLDRAYSSLKKLGYMAEIEING